MIERSLKLLLDKRKESRKVIIVLGPRQVGKTTLLQQYCEEEEEYLFLDGDTIEDRQVLQDASLDQLRRVIGRHKTVFIDEAQRIRNIGLTAKIIHDRMPEVKLILSGSAALELANEMNEPLTGRKWEYLMLPVSWEELSGYFGYWETQKSLETRIIYGMYPEVIMNPNQEQKLLKDLTGSYLYKDILSYSNIRKPELLDKLLLALALQIGSEVSYNELSKLLGVNRATIEDYINLLEKAFIIFRLNPLSRNVRSEINSSRKIYFWDTGVRNTIIGNYQSLELRGDKGGLWENFLITERLKRNAYSEWYGHSYFWRTYAQQEIDYIEEKDGKFYAFEFKWSQKAKARIPKTFTEAYPETETQIISKENFYDFVVGSTPEASGA